MTARAEGARREPGALHHTGATQGHPLPLLWGDARASRLDAAGARARHPLSTRSGNGAACESTLSPHWASHPVECRGWENPRGQDPRRSGCSSWKGSPGQRPRQAAASSGVWSWAVRGRHAAPEPCGQRGKRRGLGRDVSEPRHAVNSRRRSSNSSAGSHRRAFVSWKPDGALPSTGTARPAAALCQQRDPGDPRAVLRPVLGPHRGGRSDGGAKRAPSDVWVLSYIHCAPLLPPASTGVSQGMLCL